MSPTLPLVSGAPLLLALFAAGCPAAVGGKLADAKVQTARVEAETLEKAVDVFRLTNGKAPASLAELAAAKVVASVPQDPWGHDYALVSPGTRHRDGVDVVSPGPDGAVGTADDVTAGGAP